LLPHFGRELAHALVHDDTLGVYQEALRCGVHAPVDGGAAVVIDRDDLVGIAQLSEPGTSLRVVVFPVESDERDETRAAHLKQHAVLVPTGAAPAAPHVEQVPASTQRA